MTIRHLENRLGELERSEARRAAGTPEVEPYDLERLLKGEELAGGMRTWIMRELMLIVVQARRSGDVATALKALQILAGLKDEPSDAQQVPGSEGAQHDYADVVRAIERAEREREDRTRQRAPDLTTAA